MKSRLLTTIALASALAAQFTHADVYYWDNNTTDSGFGTAGDTWSSTGSTLWNGDLTGGSAGGLLGTNITTTTSDALNFGTATDGLGAGTVSVSGTVIANSLTFGSASGAVLLSGGTAINLGGTTPTITVNNTADTIASNITGSVGFTKDGTGILTLSSTTSTLTGTITVSNGTLKGTGSAAASSFGSKTVTRQIDVNTGGTLDFGASNMFGGHNSTFGNLVIGGGTVTNSGTDIFNSLNNVTLNGGTLTSTIGIFTGEAWGAWHINGTVTSTGTSLIEGAATNGRHIRLSATSGANTNFDVQSGTLTVSAPIYNGGRTTSGNRLTKLGSGTMILSSGANAYTGTTTVSDGILELATTGRLKFVLGATSGSNNSLTGAGTATIDGDFIIDTTAADALASGTWTLENVSTLTGGAYGGGFQVFQTNGTTQWTDAGSDKWTKVNGAKTYTFDETTGILTLATNASAYDTWKAANAPGSNPDDDTDGDGVDNAVEFVLGGTSAATDLDKLPMGSTSGTNMVFTFKRAVSSLDPKTALFIETSTDLATWNTAPSPYTVPDVAVVGPPVTVVEDSPVGFDTVTLTVPQAPDAKKFARLKVVITP